MDTDYRVFLDWLYSVVGLEVEVFDAMYEATKATVESPMIEAVRDWYIENIGDDSDKS